MDGCLILRFEHKHTPRSMVHRQSWWTRKEKPKMLGHDQWFPSSSSRSEGLCLQDNLNSEVDEDGAQAVELLVKSCQAVLKSNLEEGPIRK
jgi:hypothetical protein